MPLLVPEGIEAPGLVGIADDPPRPQDAELHWENKQDEGEPVGLRRSRGDEEDAGPPRPRRKRRQGALAIRYTRMQRLAVLLNKAPAIVILSGLGVAGLFMVVFGFIEWRVSAGATATPQAMTCQQLIDGGIPANPHVLITDVIPTEEMVYIVRLTEAEQRAGQAPFTRWSSVYVPLVPLTPELKAAQDLGDRFAVKPPGDQVRLILWSKAARNKADVEKIFTHDKVQGMIVNSISSLDSDAERLLRETFPGADLSRALILEEGREPTDPTLARGGVIGGILFIIVACGLGGVAVGCHPNR